ncbi:hypothetical protein MTO96_007662 [Rhipicephalus appendiculatus]
MANGKGCTCCKLRCQNSLNCFRDTPLAEDCRIQPLKLPKRTKPRAQPEGLRLAMENTKPPPYAQYLRGGGTVTPVKTEQEPRASSTEPLTNKELPDVFNLTLLSSTKNSITVTWDRPKTRFDYYWISISDDNRENITSKKQHYTGSCSNGTIIHPSQNRVTCTNIDPCTNFSLTVRTHINGPPERTSKGAEIGGIFIAAEDPHAPKNITAVGISPTLTRLEWGPPLNMSGMRIHIHS